jgi:predicted transcriptional regulator
MILTNEATEANSDLIALTADIVSAHVGNNNVPVGELASLISSVHAALSNIDKPVAAEAAKPEPAVSIRSSIKHDYIVCLEDGKKLKMLKRYLRTNYDMSPEDYRAKWGLPRDYPMVAPAYAETRRGLAKSIGLGRKPAAVENKPKAVIAKVKAAPKAAEAPLKAAAAKAAKAPTKVAPKTAAKPRAKRKVVTKA